MLLLGDDTTILLGDVMERYESNTTEALATGGGGGEICLGSM